MFVQMILIFYFSTHGERVYCILTSCVFLCNFALVVIKILINKKQLDAKKKINSMLERMQK